MASIEKILLPHRIDISIPPKQADLAIVSINHHGTEGQLNSQVLREYGYTEKDLPTEEQLKFGFGAIPVKPGHSRAILFVVTVDENGNTAKSLRRNLFNTLTEFRGWFRNKIVWIPLMGTGAGGLTFAESYSITARAINEFQEKFPTQFTVLISLPKDEAVNSLLYQIRSPQPENTKNTYSFSSFKGQYYLAGSVWDGEEQASRFFEENIWETGHEEKYVNAVNGAKVGDIIILKSTFFARDSSYLRIKGVGRIIENPLTGTDLKVDWKLKNIQIDIEDLGKYRRTFARVMPDDLENILIEIGRDKILDSDLFGSTAPITTETLEKSNKSIIAGLISDSDEGEDYLDIMKDVNAFSKIISARSFSPPLAIALFGKWGTGKSFFMKKLRLRIQQLSDQDTEIYCKGIAHIHFNAWSYLDANLWASLVSKIFEGLNEYISENAVVEEKEAIRKKLTGKLTMAKEEVDVLQKKKNVVESQITSLESQKGELSSEIKWKIEEIKLNSLKKLIETVDSQFKVREKIVEAITSNPEFSLTENQLKEIVPEKYWENPTKAYEKLNSKYSFIKEFLRLDKIWGNLLLLAFAGLVIWIVPGIIASIIDYFKNFNWLILQVIIATLTIAATIWKRVESTYNELQPILASFWRIKEDYNKEIKNALDKKEQEEKALKLEIEKGKAEIISISGQIQQATVIKADLEYRINNALATEALYSFIERRNVSDDYKKHLGIVSVIRKDFEILSSLFVDHGHELSSDSKKFREKFKRPLERIVLYIDDLDRCPEDRVVEVLEAVHLLMAFPLFIVIVGVDQRWVKNALMKHYKLQFAAQIDGEHATIKEIERIEASNYLEKIFQVPFHLKEASDESVKYMLHTLSQPNPLNINAQKNGGREATIDLDEVLNIDTSANKIGTKESDTTLKKKEDEVHVNRDSDIEYLILSEIEVKLMEGLSKVIGNNPRGVKRFVNVYQIVKAHEDLIYEKTHEESEFLVIMFLLALSIGPFKKLYPSFEKFINTYDNDTKTLFDFLVSTNVMANEKLYELKQDLDYIMTNSKEFNTLQREAVLSFKVHNQFIQRFTFEDTLV